MEYYYRLTQDKKLRKHLPFYINSYSSNFQQQNTNHKKGSVAHHFILTTKGSGYAVIDGKNFELNTGDIFFYKAGIPVSYYKKENGFTTCFVSFNGSGCAPLFEYYKIPKYTVFKSASFSSTLTNFCNFADKAVSDERIAGRIYSVIIDFCLMMNKSETPKTFETAISYIKRNFSRDIPIADLAKIAGVSQSVLFKQFKEILDTTPVAYITSLRIDYAKSSLESLPYMPLDQIARLSGFSSTSYFIKTFKKHENITPAKYRKLNMK